ncbi:Os03g0244466 [Oryza sativa Japonica Group]|uniref:Os03g0244466 protein n=1 Tax=Oryza sativa subsp. japonica TaxID=39947 RepID=A0A0P0VVI6_ORYSJ|nr:hypothetical protein EE612_016444 [Oryza sativa]BAS83224.1 Os03g0244466 [Oryza sativa Japonica Group]
MAATRAATTTSGSSGSVSCGAAWAAAEEAVESCSAPRTTIVSLVDGTPAACGFSPPEYFPLQQNKQRTQAKHGQNTEPK